jgi:hypothetical protein
MRQSRLIGAAAAAAVIAGSVFAGTSAYAQAPSNVPTGQAAAPTTVTLPTGDRVTVLPNGSTAIEPAPGREDASFITPSSPSGDIVVVPTDQVAAIQAGEADPRRYNVSELLGAGITDAAAAPESELDDRPYAGLIPDTAPAAFTAEEEEDLQKLRVSLRDRDGEAPDQSWVMWAARDGSDFGLIEIEDYGDGGVALPSGDYVVVAGFWAEPTETERGQMIMGMTPVTIGDTLYDLVLDGADAQPVSVDVEREDAQALSTIMSIEARHDDVNLGYGTYISPQHDAFLLPEPDLAEFTQGFLYQTVFTSPEGAEEAYAYNLAFHDAAGYPEDTVYSVADDDLAIVETDYRDLGVPTAGATCDYGDLSDRQIGLGFCRVLDTVVPSQRTMYYTADPEIKWDNAMRGGELNEEGDFTDGFFVSYDAVFEPGRSDRVMPRGGLAAGISSAARFNEEGADFLYAPVAPVGGGNDEQLVIVGAKGTYELSRDGETLAAGEGHDFYWQNVFTELAAGDAGRYTLAADVTQAAATTVFGTDASVEWQFDSAPVEEWEWRDLALPVVQFSAEDIEGGYGERGACQEITLELRVDEYGPVVHAVDMAFEVSYDDGRTWKAVDIERDGDIATAELRHPRGAEFVSVRMSATDDAGTEVEHTTIRAYGIE